MNKVYKVIWSKARNCYVVVSEIAKRNSKGATTTDKRRKVTAGMALAAMAAMLNFGTLGTVEAAEGVTAAGSNAYAFGYYANAVGKNATAWGNETYAGNIYFRSDTNPKVGYPVRTRDGYYFQYLDGTQERINASVFNNIISSRLEREHRNATAFGTNTVAIGDNSTAFGTGTLASSSEMNIYYRSETNRKEGIPVYIEGDGYYFKYLDGTQDRINESVYNTILAQRLSRTATANSTAFGTNTKATNENSTAFGFNTEASGINATAFGGQTKATELNATSFGSETEATGQQATAFGRRTEASGAQATAFGYKTKATADNATAFGHETEATANRATAFGIETKASGKNSTSFGYRSEASGENSTSFGSNTQAVGGGATAFGAYNEARAENSVAWGNHTYVSGGALKIDDNLYTDLETLRYTGSDNYYLVGRDVNGNVVRLGGKDDDPDIITNGFRYTETDSAAWQGVDEIARDKVDQWIISSGGSLAGRQGTSFGSKTIASNVNATAFGASTTASGRNSTTFGSNTLALGENSVAWGEGSQTGNYSYQSSGYNNYNQNVRIVRNEVPNDPSNPSLGTRVYYTLKGTYFDSVYNNYYHTITDGNNNVVTFNTYEEALAALTPTSEPTNATAFGLNSKSYSDNSLAALGGQVGYPKLDYYYNPNDTIENSAAIGQGSLVGSRDAFAMGKDATVSVASRGSVALGGTGDINKFVDYWGYHGNTNTQIYGSTNAFATTGALIESSQNAIAMGNASVGPYSYGSVALGGIGTRSGDNAEHYGNGRNTAIATGATNSLAAVGGFVGKESPDSIAIGGSVGLMAANSIAIGGMVTTNSDIYDNGNNDKDHSENMRYYDGSQWLNYAAAENASVSNQATGAIAIGSASGSVVNRSSENPTVTNYTAAAKATVSKAVALGSGSVANREAGKNAAGMYTSGYDVATDSEYNGLGATGSTWTSTVAGLSVGGGTVDGKLVTRQITGVAAGIEDTDAVNVAQLKRAAIFTDNRNVGILTNIDGQKEITSPFIHIEGVEEATRKKERISTLNSLTTKKHALEHTKAMLSSKLATLTSELNSLSYARIEEISAKQTEINIKQAQVTKVDNEINQLDSAITYAQWEIDYLINTGQYNDNSFASATGKNAIALGNTATASGDNSIAMGTGATAKGSGTIAIGNAAQTENVFRATAIGQNANAKLDDSVALGSNSVANREAGKDAAGNAASGYDVLTGKASTDTSTTWRSNLSAVSVGDGATKTRQITGLAAGYEDTDAVNVAQLKLTAIETDNRNVGVIINANGRQEIVSPYIQVEGVEAAAPAMEFIKTFSDLNQYIAYLSAERDKYAPGSPEYASFDARLTSAATDYAQQKELAGTFAKALSPGSVALGSNSVASRTAGAVGYDAIGADHGSDTTGVWKSTLAAVSVGDAANKKTRQLTGLAAGTADTDAVNVAQLKQLQWNIGTGTTSKSEPSFLKPVGGAMHDVVMRAGDGVRITATERTSGYDIEFSSYFTNLETTVPGGNFIDSITYKGKPYYINGGGSGIVDAISDNRAVIVAPDSVDILNDQGEVTGKRHYLKIHSPYININGLSGTEFYDEPQDYFALAQKSGSMAIGIHSKAAEENSTAIGHNADAMGLDSTAIGYNSHAHGNNSVAIGIASTTSGNRAIAIGTSASNTSNEDYNPTNPHQGARAAGMGAIALGDRAMVLSSEYLSDDKYVDNPQPDDSVNDAIAIGTRTQARARNAIAVGGDTSYTYKDETGKIVTIYGADDDVQGGRNYGAVVGDGAHSGIAIGGAYGTFDNMTKTIHQEMDAAATYGIRGIAIGSGALVANPDDFADLKEALSDPTYVNIKREFHTARSNHLEAKAEWDAIKDLTINDPSLPEGMRVSQIKYDAAKEKYESTLQKMNEATAKYSMALKEVVRLQVKDSVLEEDAIAIGTLANASIRDSVALGSHSITDSNDKAGSRTGISGYDPLGKASDNDYFRGDNKYSEDDPVWRSTAGSLSVGGTYYKKDTDGNYETDDDGNLVVDKVITRRISHVAAGVKDSDAVNVAQLKRATTISSDSRNTALGVDENGNMIVNSPFLAISGVEESSDNNTIVRKYRNSGGADGYVNGLQQESDEIQGRIDSINATRAEIDKALNGYTDGNGKFVDGIEQKYEKRLALEKQYKTGQITRERYLEESADLITVEDYTLHKTEYTDQLIATEARLKDLEESQKVYTDLLADNGKKAKEKYTEAETYFNSQANADGTDSMAVGHKSKAGGKQSIAIGKNNEVGTTGEIENKDSEAIKAKREKEAANSVALGIGNKITGTANTESSTESMTLGVGNTITNANKAMAIGSGNIVEGDKSLAIGTENEVYGTGSGAIGDPTIINANNSYSIGNNNTIGGKGKGEDASVTLNNVFILGNNSSVDVNDTVVLGSNIHILEGMPESSVFLGNDSGYTSDTSVTGATGTVSNATVGNITFGGFAGDTANGVVSVGYQGEIDGAPATTVRRIQNVAAGLISAESTDAINGSQLYAAIQAMSINVVADADKSAKVVRDPETGVGSGGGTGTAATTYTVSAGSTTIQKTSANLSESGNLTIEDVKEGTETDPKSYEYKIDLNKDISVDSVTAGDPAGDSSKLDKNGLTITGGPNGNPVTINNKKVDVAGNKIENVADGQGANDAVNVSQLQNSGISFKGDSGDSGLVNLGDKYNASFNVKGDNNITTEASAGQLKIKLKEQIDLGENGSVTIGNTTVKNNSVAIEGGPSMTKDGIDMKDKKITNVKAGEADTDAVNYGQLKDYVANNNQAVTNLGNQITGVESRMKKGLAGAAALAALHPMDFDPDDKLTFAAGMGHYRGESAAALGLFYRPDEKVMFSLGGTLGNGENMINAGVSFSLDRTPRVTGSRTALTKEVVALREHVARQDAQIAELTALVRQLAGNAGLQVPASSALPTEGPALFADNLDNKWVYDAIEDLEQRGYFNGYAGRALTRQQIAAVLDMAMSGGAKLDERIVKEFEPELSHVRLAHVEGKGNNEGEWYERPRASHDKYEDKHKIEKKPFRVEEKK